MPPTDELWRVIPGLERYEASDQGNIRHTARKRLLVLQEHRMGYLYFYYWPETGPQPRRRKKFYVHRAVALAFLGPPPTLFHTVDHVRGDRSDNRAVRLQWKTHSEQRRNQGHSRRPTWSESPDELSQAGAVPTVRYNATDTDEFREQAGHAYPEAEEI